MCVIDTEDSWPIANELGSQELGSRMIENLLKKTFAEGIYGLVSSNGKCKKGCFPCKCSIKVTSMEKELNNQVDKIDDLFCGCGQHFSLAIPVIVQ